jgi:ssRNA-specific RNase YbeY (16S rRNA maturation enzyme)
MAIVCVLVSHGVAHLDQWDHKELLAQKAQWGHKVLLARKVFLVQLGHKEFRDRLVRQAQLWY